MESSDKKLFIGVDEAGYGPNLGPLVIAASVWEVPKSFSEFELCAALEEDFREESWHSGSRRVPLGDSKRLYQPGAGLTTLETGLLAMLRCLPHRMSLTSNPQLPADLSELLADTLVHLPSNTNASDCPEGTPSEPDPLRSSLPWYADLRSHAVPCSQSIDEIERLSEIAMAGLSKGGMRCLAIRAVVIAESRFNQEVERLGSKGQLLSQATLQLVSHMVGNYDGPAEIFCDRQGGRKNYLPILLDAFPEEWFRETLASPQRCSYRNSAHRSLGIHFSVKGDRFPPTALASMCAKYVRERLMEALNRFWRSHLPTVKPTAGYPLDAKRFREQIESTARRLQLETSTWWRCR